jgi:hypothetical protein
MGAGMAEGRAARQELGPGVVVRPARRSEIPAVLALWREADAVPSISDDPASLRRLLDTSEDALLVAETADNPEPGGPEPDGPGFYAVTYGADGAFHSDTMLVKHGEQYRPPAPGETPPPDEVS